MDSTRLYKFRLYPDAKHQSEIDMQFALSKGFYNLLLKKSIKIYKEGSKKAFWNTFSQLLSYKAESAGMKFMEVDPRNTTKDHNNCGNMKSMPISKRVYYCEICGLTEGRYINASINIHKRATDGQAGSYVQGDFVGSQQEAVVEELKTYSASKEWNS